MPQKATPLKGSKAAPPAHSPFPATGLSPAIQRLLKSSQESVLWIDGKGSARWLNDSMRRMTGVEDAGNGSLQDLAGLPFAEAEHSEAFLKAVREVVRGECLSRLMEDVPFNAMPSGLRWVSLEIVALDQADGGGALVHARDVSRRRRAENDLDLLLRSSLDGIFVIDRTGQITMFNDACERITGYPREEVLYQSCACQTIFTCALRADPGAPNLCPGRMVFEGNRQVGPLELQIATKEGKSKWIEISYSPIQGPAGETHYFIGIMRDVSDRKRLEEQVQLGQKLATLGELVAGLAHEIRNPLSIIRSAADIVANEDRPPPQRREAAEFIKEEAARLDRTMKTLLNLSRPARSQPDTVDLNAILQQTVSFYAPQRDGFSVITDFSPDLPLVCGSRDSLQSVFINLMLNADHAMPDGGALRIRTERDGDTARIVFQDEGAGIAPEHFERIFQPFFTTKKSGTGLGLSLAAHVIEAHGGAIRAENSPEGGARFTIEILGCMERSETADSIE